MLELNAARKIKINLENYDFQTDIKNRIFFSTLSLFDLTVLEEILFSPIKITLEKFIKNIKEPKDKVLNSLSKIASTGLLKLEAEQILICKNTRKYFDFQISAFDDSFQPNLEFIQNLLKKVPIQLLPIWYSLPKTSNNIFQSIVERFLLTPSIFQRHLDEMKQKEPLFQELIDAVYNSDKLEVPTNLLKEKLKLSNDDFHKALLMLEFSFILSLRYQKTEDGIEEIATPFLEWKEYLSFLQKNQPAAVDRTFIIKRTHSSDFGFLEELTHLLSAIQKNPAKFDMVSLSQAAKSLNLETPACTKLLPRALQLKLTELIQGKLQITSAGQEFLTLNLEKKSMQLLEKPAKFLPFSTKEIKMAAGAIERALDQEWLFLDQFIEGVAISLKPEQNIELTSVGKTFKYNLPDYTEDEKKLIKHSISGYLYEAGIVATGSASQTDGKAKACFKVTDFGKTIFEM